MRSLILLAALRVGAFTTSSDGRPPSRLRAEAKQDAIVDASGWPRVKAMLDRLPVFTVANEQGQPIQYEASGKPLALLYADVDAAKNELLTAKMENPEMGLDLVPMGLGEAFQLHRKGMAVLIPAQASLEAAGAPKGASPLGQELPLFACMEMAVQGEDGKPVLPLFLDRAEAQQAVEDAMAADEGGAKLEIVGLSLHKALEQLVSQESSAFSFVPPPSSLAHIQSYLENSGGVGTKTS